MGINGISKERWPYHISKICRWQNIKELYKLDKPNGNNIWTLAIEQEITLLWDDFEYYKVAQNNKVTHEYQNIPLLWTFAVRFHGRNRARLVAGGRTLEWLLLRCCWTWDN